MESRRTRLVVKEAGAVVTVAARVAIWEPGPAAAARIPTTSELLNRTLPPGNLPPALEASILATLTRPLLSHEAHHAGNANRERELCELLATLDAVQAHHLGRRLDLQRPDDRLAQAFRGLLAERRQRVRAFIADTRRRIALSHAGAPA